MLQDTFNSEIPERTCHHCGHQGKPLMNGKFSEIHGYAFKCEDCGQWIAWGGKKKQIVTDGQRKFSTQWTPARLGINFCQMCLRPDANLGTSETLTSHHIIQIKAGGEDEPGNIWVVCTPCHRLIHHQRVYLYEHNQKFVDSHAALERFKRSNPDLYARIRGEEVGHEQDR
jgi:5-methylcytosine-specific restriction endonuclease McrA